MARRSQLTPSIRRPGENVKTNEEMAEITAPAALFEREIAQASPK